jgi:hypothetical protein
MTNVVLLWAEPKQARGICLQLSDLEAAQLIGLLREQTLWLHPLMQVKSPWTRLAERIVQAASTGEACGGF